eukprot:IDg7719t1
MHDQRVSLERFVLEKRRACTCRSYSLFSCTLQLQVNGQNEGALYSFFMYRYVVEESSSARTRRSKPSRQGRSPLLVAPSPAAPSATDVATLASLSGVRLCDTLESPYHGLVAELGAETKPHVYELHSTAHLQAPCFILEKTGSPTPPGYEAQIFFSLVCATHTFQSSSQLRR